MGAKDARKPEDVEADDVEGCGTSFDALHWLNIEPCGMICASITWLIVLYCEYAVTVSEARGTGPMVCVPLARNGSGCHAVLW